MGSLMTPEIKSIGDEVVGRLLLERIDEEDQEDSIQSAQTQ